MQGAGDDNNWIQNRRIKPLSETNVEDFVVVPESLDPKKIYNRRDLSCRAGSSRQLKKVQPSAGLKKKIV